MIKRLVSMAAVVFGLSGCVSPVVAVPPSTPTSPPTPGKLGGYDPARSGPEDVTAALAAGERDGRKVLIVFGAEGNADCRALALLSGDPAVAPLLADYHVVTVDVEDPGPNLEDNRAIPDRLYADLDTSRLPGVLVTKVTADNRTVNEFTSDDGSFAHARSMTATQLAAFLTKWR